jgi:hypothetical protein
MGEIDAVLRGSNEWWRGQGWDPEIEEVGTKLRPIPTRETQRSI